MLQRAERFGPQAALDRLAARLRLKAVFLQNEVLAGSSDLVLIGLICLGLALQSVVLFSPGHFRPSPTGLFAVLVAAGTLGSLLVCLIATLPLKKLLSLRSRQALAALALLTLAILSTFGLARTVMGISSMAHGTPYNNDGAVMDLHASQRVLHGNDPYQKTNIVTALAAINAPSTTTTPLMDGQFRGTDTYPSAAAIDKVFLSDLRFRPRSIPPEFESKYNYPAGSFLFVLPFVGAGLGDMRFLFALAILGIGAYLWFRMPTSLRWLVPFIVLANVPLIVLTAGGQPDPIYGLFLIIAFGELSRRWVSPVSLGIAAATKQLAWFFLPFYFLLIVRERGWREAFQRSGLIALTFALMNGPFILESPRDYLASVFAPMIDPMFPVGIGIVALFVSNILPMMPKLAFSLAEIGSWLAGVATYARSRYLTAAAIPVLAALPLFFAWRSLVNYFYLVPLLVYAISLRRAEGEPARALRS